MSRASPPGEAPGGLEPVRRWNLRDRPAYQNAVEQGTEALRRVETWTRRGWARPVPEAVRLTPEVGRLTPVRSRKEL